MAKKQDSKEDLLNTTDVNGIVINNEIDNVAKNEIDNKDLEIEKLKIQLAKMQELLNEKEDEEIGDRELINVRSITNGTVSYYNPQNGVKYFWNKFDAIQKIRAEEVRRMNALHPKYFEKYVLVIEDQRMVKELNLSYLYENFNINDIRNIDALFNEPIEVLQKKINRLPIFVKDLLKENMRNIYFENKINDLSKIRYLCEILQIDYQDLEAERLYRNKDK